MRRRPHFTRGKFSYQQRNPGYQRRRPDSVPHGVVYILSHPHHPKWCKIGYSSHVGGSQFRAQHYADAHGMEPWEVYREFTSPFPMWVEQNIHEKLKARRKELYSGAREVFAVRPQEAEPIVIEAIEAEVKLKRRVINQSSEPPYGPAHQPRPYPTVSEHSASRDVLHHDNIGDASALPFGNPWIAPKADNAGSGSRTILDSSLKVRNAAVRFLTSAPKIAGFVAVCVIFLTILGQSEKRDHQSNLRPVAPAPITALPRETPPVPTKHWAVVQALQLNLRSGPSTDSPVITVMDQFGVVELISDFSNDWNEVIATDREGAKYRGYAHGAYLSPMR